MRRKSKLLVEISDWVLVEVVMNAVEYLLTLIISAFTEW